MNYIFHNGTIEKQDAVPLDIPQDALLDETMANYGYDLWYDSEKESFNPNSLFNIAIYSKKEQAFTWIAYIYDHLELLGVFTITNPYDLGLFIKTLGDSRT